MFGVVCCFYYDRAAVVTYLRVTLQPDLCHGVSEKRCVFAAVDLDGVEAGAAGLSGDS